MSIYALNEEDLEIFQSLKDYQLTQEDLDRCQLLSIYDKSKNGFYGKSHTLETKLLFSKLKLGTKHSSLTKQKMSNKRKGVPKPPGFNHNFIGGEIQKTRIKSGEHNFIQEHICPHCGKLGKSASMFRWHFDNCKSK